MSIYSRGKKWYVDYYFSGTRIRRGGFKKKTDAKDYLTKCRNDILYRKHPMPRSKAVTFNELAYKYIAEHSKLHKTAKSYKTDISLIKSLLKYFDGFFLRDIDTDVVDDYKIERLKATSLHGRAVSKTTINREVGLIRNMLNHAIQWKMIEYNPILKVQMFREEPRENVLTESELQALIDSAPHPLQEIIITALNTGMRKSELLGLKWTDINLDEKVLTVKKTKTMRNKARSIPLNHVMSELLSRLYLKRKGNIFVFQNNKTNNNFIDIKKAWKTLLKRCKIENTRFHDLRHCFATYTLLHSGGNLRDLQDVLGHERITTTTRYAKSILVGKKKLVDSFQIGTKPGEIQKLEELA